MGLGWRFWLSVIGVTLAVGIGAMLVFMLFTSAWYAWGFFGAFIAFGAVAIFIAYLYDRREEHRRGQLSA